MLRVFKPTSPMNMGSWILAVYAPAAVGAELLAETRPAAGAAPALAGRRGGVRAGVGHLHGGAPRRHRGSRVARGPRASCRSPSPAARPRAPASVAMRRAAARPTAASARRLLVLGSVAPRSGPASVMERRLGDRPQTRSVAGVPGRLRRASSVPVGRGHGARPHRRARRSRRSSRSSPGRAASPARPSSASPCWPPAGHRPPTRRPPSVRSVVGSTIETRRAEPKPDPATDPVAVLEWQAPERGGGPTPWKTVVEGPWRWLAARSVPGSHGPTW